MLGLLAGACASSSGPPALRLPFEDHGACPFECCTYREWTVEEPTVLYRERDVRSPQSAPEDVWWVQVRNRDGQVGWTDRSDHFGNMDACG